MIIRIYESKVNYHTSWFSKWKLVLKFLQNFAEQLSHIKPFIHWSVKGIKLYFSNTEFNFQDGAVRYIF